MHDALVESREASWKTSVILSKPRFFLVFTIVVFTNSREPIGSLSYVICCILLQVTLCGVVVDKVTQLLSAQLNAMHSF